MSAMAVTSGQFDEVRAPRPDLYLAGGTAVDGVPAVAERWVITRRGRLAATLTGIMILAIAVMLALSMIGPASAGSQVVVQPGQTLSEVAATELPHVSVDRAIVEIQLANQMNTLQVQAGQTLIIP